MNIITLDFETFWDASYSLSKMSPLEYVLGAEFEVISCAIKLNALPTQVFFGEDAVRAEFERLDIKNSALLGHNMLGFDSYIAAYRFGLNPKLWMCTLAMARPVHAKGVGLGLAKLVEFYKLGVKDNTVLLATKGRRLVDFTALEIEGMKTYNTEDCDQCYALMEQLTPHTSASELWQIDALTRMRTEPKFTLDYPLLKMALWVEQEKKLTSLQNLATMLDIDLPEPTEAVRAKLASPIMFSDLLKLRGVAVPTKPSPTDPTGQKEIPALAKTDEGFLALLEHDDAIVAEAARVRLEIKSTLVETRIQKFLAAGDLAGGMLPVPLRYCGADTTGRDSGEEYNCQNLPRISRTPKTSDALRNSMRAPAGYMVIVADQSAIELRVNHFLWKVKSSMALYAQDPKADLYRAFGAYMLGKPAAEVSADERQLAKVAQLGLGFGAGAATFQRVAKLMGGIELTFDQAEETTHKWRTEYAAIVDGWQTCHNALLDISSGKEKHIDPWGLTHTEKEGIRLPSGRLIRYPDLRKEENEEGKKEWVYARGRHQAKIYAGKIVENIVQSLARDSIFDCAIDFFVATGRRFRPALRVHDELVYVVPSSEAEALLAELQAAMARPPRWWPELIVSSAGGIDQCYGAAK